MDLRLCKNLSIVDWLKINFKEGRQAAMNAVPASIMDQKSIRLISTEIMSIYYRNDADNLLSPSRCGLNPTVAQVRISSMANSGAHLVRP